VHGVLKGKVLLKKKVIPIAKTTIGLKCGDCLHFKRAPKFEKVCSTLGVKHFANAPNCYDPDVFQLASQDPEVLNRLGLLIKDMSSKDTRVFMSLMKRTIALEKAYKLKFGQPVYFCLGQPYLSNYFRGYVVGGSEGGEPQVYISSTLSKRQRKQPMIATLDRTSVFTVPEFKKQKEKLVKENRLQDPDPLFSTAPKSVVVDTGYVVPNMETADKSWFDKDTKPVKKKSNSTNRRHSAITGELEFKVK
jgi:hypothetical protein